MSLIIQVKDLMLKPGSMKEINLKHTLQSDMGTEIISVKPGEEIELSVRLESVHEGILVTAEGETEAASECSRCLDAIRVRIPINFQELYHYQPESEEDFFIEQDRVDLEQPLIDAVVLELPIKPLCREDCPGICADCGEKLDQGNHDHQRPIDPRFDALKDFGS